MISNAGWLPVAESARNPKPAPLLYKDPKYIDDFLLKWHSSEGDLPVHALGCYLMENARTSGRGFINFGELLVSEEFIPTYLAAITDLENSAEIKRTYRAPDRTIDEPCVIFAGHGVQVYGHFLIELLPRLLIAQAAMPDTDLRYLLDRTAPSWLLQILKGHFGVDERNLVFFDTLRETIGLRNAVVPTHALSKQGALHPYLNTLLGRLAPEPESRPTAFPDRVFLTRVNFSNPFSIKRKLVNELALIAIAEDYGFAVLEPEKLSWPEQIALFRTSKILIGPFGSALHTALFSPPGTRIGAIGALNLVQSRIGNLRGQRNAYCSTQRIGDSDLLEASEVGFRGMLDGLLSQD